MRVDLMLATRRLKRHPYDPLNPLWQEFNR